MSAGYWAAEGIRYAVANGLMTGTSATTFAPAATTTRGMLMTVLARQAGEDTTGGSVWYEKGMEWAKTAGVSDGTNPGGRHHPRAAGHHALPLCAERGTT